MLRAAFQVMILLEKGIVLGWTTEVLKTMEDTMVLINQSFDLAVRQAAVLYGGPPPSGQFDQDMEVVEGRLVPAEAGQPADEADPASAVLNIVD